MMNRCAKCRIKSGSVISVENDISFFRFPSDDVQRRLSLEFCGVEEDLLKSSSFAYKKLFGRRSMKTKLFFKRR